MHSAAGCLLQVAIIGGGPHALAVLAALHEKSFASPQFRDDAAYALRVGFNSHKLTGTVKVIDPGDCFCDEWGKRFRSLEYVHVRVHTAHVPDTTTYRVDFGAPHCHRYHPTQASCDAP